MKTQLKITNKIKKTMIASKIRKIKKPDWIQVFLNRNKKDKPTLIICEKGNIRELKISRKVAEVLIACRINYGN